MYYRLPSSSELIPQHRPNGLSSSRVLNLNSSQIFHISIFHYSLRVSPFYSYYYCCFISGSLRKEQANNRAFAP